MEMPRLDTFISDLIDYVEKEIIPKEDSAIGKITCNYLCGSKGTPIHVYPKGNDDQCLVFYAERLWYFHYETDGISGIAEKLNNIVEGNIERLKEHANKPLIKAADVDPKTAIVTTALMDTVKQDDVLIRRDMPEANLTLFLKAQVDNNEDNVHEYAPVEYDDSDTDIDALWKSALYNTWANTPVSVSPDGLMRIVTLRDENHFTELFYLFSSHIYMQLAEKLNVAEFCILPKEPFVADVFLIPNKTTIPDDELRERISDEIKTSYYRLVDQVTNRGTIGGSNIEMPYLIYNVENKTYHRIMIDPHD